MKNYGLIESIPLRGDRRLGAVRKTVVQPDRNWGPYLPKKELQAILFETATCVSFSLTNCCEMQIKKQTGVEINISDRFLAKKSGTDPRLGNYFTNVFKSFDKDGFILEAKYPNDAQTIQEYYQEVPDYYGDYQLPFVPLHKQAKIMRDNIYYEPSWVGYGGVTNEELYEALLYSPVQITVKAWKQPNSKGVYSYVDKGVNHAVTLFKMTEDGHKHIFDHYDQEIKILSPNFYVGAALSHIVEIKEKPELEFFVPLYNAKYGSFPKYPQYEEYLKTKKV